MSHTLETRGARFHHDGDFSGSVLISLKPGAQHRRSDSEELELDVADLLEFAAAFIRSRRIAHLEDAPTEDVLFGRWRGR